VIPICFHNKLHKRGDLLKFEEAINEFLDYIEVTKSKGTLNYYKNYCNKLNRYFWKYDLDEIDKKEILYYIKYEKMLNPDLTHATINKAVQTLKTMIKYTTNRVIEFEKLKEKKNIIQTIPDQTIRKIFSYFEKEVLSRSELRNYAYLRLLYDTGLRLSEINNLKIQNVDFEYNTILVLETKTDVDRYVVFSNKTKIILKKYIIILQPKDFLFYNFKNHGSMTTTSIETMISRLKKKLKIKDNITPHKWRHTFATRFIRLGGDLETLRLLLGHTNLKTTQKYLHMNKQDIINNYNFVMKG